jgi:hypothetical protein
MKGRPLFHLLSAVILSTSVTANASQPEIHVYKSEYCGCCTEWVKHLEANGFTVKAENVTSPMEYREKFGIPDKLGSCHSGQVQGYALEGHVPAAEIKRLLAEKPKAKGLAVPSMPMGSPGMEGDRKDAYDVFLVHSDGSYKTYQHYSAN